MYKLTHFRGKRNYIFALGHLRVAPSFLHVCAEPHVTAALHSPTIVYVAEARRLARGIRSYHDSRLTARCQNEGCTLATLGKGTQLTLLRAVRLCHCQ